MVRGASAETSGRSSAMDYGVITPRFRKLATAAWLDNISLNELGELTNAFRDHCDDRVGLHSSRSKERVANGAAGGRDNPRASSHRPSECRSWPEWTARKGSGIAEETEWTVKNMEIGPSNR